MTTDAPIYGLLAEFAQADELTAAARATHLDGYRKMDAYTPFPIEGLAEAIGFRTTRLPWLILGGGLVGCLGGFALQYWVSVSAYPENIGGRPLNSWPAFIPVTFELTVLVAAITAVCGMLGLNGLPMPYHSLFNVPRFAEVSRDCFFLCIEARDPRFDLDSTRLFLESLKPRAIFEVPP